MVRHGLPRWMSLALGAALAVPLLVYASTGAFARYVADDYCWAGTLRTDGFINSQIGWYVGYSPRYAFTFVVNLVELAGPSIVPLLPTVAIVVALVVTAWTLCQFGLSLLPAALLAQVAVLATLQTAPDLGQSLYWQTGMLTYLLPLVLCTLLIGWIGRARSVRSAALGGSSLITFVAGGLSETYLIPQNVGLTLSLLICLALLRGGRRRTVTAHLVAALAGGLLALAVILIAPATAYRVGGSPADLWLAMSAAIATAFVQVARLLRSFAPTLLLCLVTPGLIVGMRCSRIDRRWLVAVSAVVMLTLPFCYFPSFYAQNGNPPARSLIVPGAILIGYTLFVGYAAGSVVMRALETSPRIAPAFTTAVLALVPLGVALTSLPERAQAAEYAALWDAEDQQIRARRDAGEADLTVARLPKFLGEDFVGSDRRDWFNRCVARYYDVRTIASVEAAG
jgi:hypothetical protein